MGIGQAVKPKHHVLAQRCYPRFQKSNTEVKPNSSELSYLLYYCSTRRSKLQKVGDYLETRTQADVRKGRLGNIQVTLQIITALIEKCPRDLPLYASSVLHIIASLLESGDVNFVEESVQAFSMFCNHYDLATFSADLEHVRQYDTIVKTYASIASKNSPTPGRSRGMSVPEELRFRSAGLRAIKSLVASGPFGADGKYLNIVMPSILESLYSENQDYLVLVRQREDAKDRHEKELSLRRRQSISVQRSTEMSRATESSETDPSTAAGTTADFDKRANEEVGVLALQSLRQIFSADNRSQVRMATFAVIGFTSDRVLPSDGTKDPSLQAQLQARWPIELFEEICLWTPVQDRFIVLVTAMESLVNSPILEEDIPRQLILVRIAASLLQSNINFIGLSVMDVMIGMIQHILRLLQLGGQGSNVSPHPQQPILFQPEGAGTAAATKRYLPHSPPSSAPTEIVKKPSTPRLQLLGLLKHCIGDLATHVYYSDQIGDMVSALLSRLKPSAASGTGSTTTAVENPSGMVQAIAESENLQEKPHTDGFFSFETARVLALQAVKRILVVANSKREDGGGAVGRNRVEVSVWEGTQWLLRDPQSDVRRAYVDALLTWLQLEVDRRNLRVVEQRREPGRSVKATLDQGEGLALAKRAASNASQRPSPQTRAHNSFLQLLHLAVYENALTYSESESEILLLHLLLVNLVQKLGVNSVRTGLPMIFKLQEESQHLSTQAARVAVASLVHGYFWAITESFDFEASKPGREIHGEISRRASKGAWVESVRMPPVTLENLGPATGLSLSPEPMQNHSDDEPLQLFQARSEMVDAIADGYHQNVTSPSTSPSASPGRSFTLPSFHMSGPAPPPSVTEKRLPPKIKEQMLEEWSREACIAAADKERAKSLSIAPSKPASGSGSAHRNHLAVDGRNGSGSPVEHFGRPKSFTQGSFRGVGPFNNASRRQLPQRGSDTPVSESSARSVVRVEDLKRVLSGDYAAAMPTSRRGTDLDDSSSDSMISASLPPSESSRPSTANDHTAASRSVPVVVRRPSREADPLHHVAPPPDTDVPPVPVVPLSLKTAELKSRPSVEKADPASDRAGEVGPSSGSAQVVASATTPVAPIPGRGNLRALLNEVDTKPKRSTSPMEAPPY